MMLQSEAYKYQKNRLKEPWTQNTEVGRLKLNTDIHLYRLVGHEDATAQLISENADEIIRLKDDKRAVPKDL